MGYGNLVLATEPIIGHVRHVIIDNMPSNGMNYELYDPYGSLHKGYLNPGQTVIFNFNDITENVYGPYSLSYYTCMIGWLGIGCKPSYKILMVTQDDDVTWEVTSSGLKVNESVH